MKQFDRAIAKTRKNDSVRDIPKKRAYTVKQSEIAGELKKLTFGVELEFMMEHGRAASKVAEALRGRLIKKPMPQIDCFNPRVYDIEANGKIWGIDQEYRYTSVSACPTTHLADNPYENAAELVSPPMNYSELPELERAIYALSRTGAYGNYHCAMHVHLDGDTYMSQQNGFENPLCRLLGNFFVNQDFLYKACHVYNGRQKYAHKLDENLLKNMLAATTEKERADTWYELDQSREQKFNATRIRGINLHAYYFKGTIESRFLNSPIGAAARNNKSTHFDYELAKAGLDLTLLLHVASLNDIKLPPILREGKSEKQGFKEFLIESGLYNDEFGSTIDLLTHRLSDEIVSKPELDAYMRNYDRYCHGSEIILDVVTNIQRTNLPVHTR
jgi:hypothetical protein